MVMVGRGRGRVGDGGRVGDVGVLVMVGRGRGQSQFFNKIRK